MKLRERYFAEDGKIIVEETHDPTPFIERAGKLRSHGLTGFSEHKHVGTVPNFLLEHWLREAGISFTDQEAVKDLVKRKMLSGDFAALRVWEGSY